MLEWITNLDGQALLFIQEHLRSGLGDRLMVFWSTMGNGGMLWISLGVLMLFFKRTRRVGVVALAGLLLNWLAVNVTIKPLIDRPRPWTVIEGLEPLISVGASRSFPSGHTSGSFSFAIAVASMVEKKWIKVLVIAAAALMGLSRLYVGVHFPTDVLGGAIIGGLCGWMASVLYRKFFQKRFPLN